MATGDGDQIAGIGPEAANVVRQTTCVARRGWHDALGRDADHVHVGMDVDARCVGVEDGHDRCLLAWRPRCLGLGLVRTLALAHGVGYLVKVCKESRRGPRGDRRNAVSPTGSTHRLRPTRVTNDRVAASRARLHHGQEAPVPCRPRTHAGRSILATSPRQKSNPALYPVHGPSGAARGAEVASILSAAGSPEIQ